MRDSFILLSIQSTDRHFSGNSSSEKVPLIKEKCWKVIENAISLGHTKLRKRHIHSFSQHMTASDITFSHPDSPTSSNSITKSSFASHLTTMYWFNKYLLLSSASRSVSNLQGLWSDGPWNPWSSDYHLNINLQMMYWPTFAFGLHNTISLPLIEFLKDISITGRIPARNLYNSSGWVAHGFTDEYLNVGIRGDLQWALCVTCGSWIALYLWDYLLYSDFSLDFTINTFLPIFSTMIEFYFNYLFLGPDNYIHTGPTTSPENSYSGYSSLLNRKIIQYLTFSPAIDMSILRQVCSFFERSNCFQVANSYSMAIQWSYYSIHKDEKKNKKILDDLDSHRAIGKRFHLHD